MTILEILLNTQDLFGKFAYTWRDVLSQVFCRQSNGLNNYLCKRYHVISLVIFVYIMKESFSSFFDRSSRYNRVKKNQLDAQLVLGIFRQPVHVSGLSRSIIRRYNRMYTTFGTYSFSMKNKLCIKLVFLYTIIKA